MINIITQFVCDWYEEVYESDFVGAEATKDAVDNGWRNDSGNDFCCEICFDKHFARLQEQST